MGKYNTFMASYDMFTILFYLQIMLNVIQGCSVVNIKLIENFWVEVLKCIGQ